MNATFVISPDRFGRSPLRRLAWRMFYSILARRFPMREWTFMNYGYASSDGVPDGLAVRDEACRAFVALYARVVSSAGPLEGLDVVEVGSGRGGGARWMSEDCGARTVLGVDLAPPAVELARRLHADMPGLSFVVGDADDLPCRDRSADLVANVESCHHYPSLDGFVAEAARVLRPGGWFCLASYFDEAGARRWRDAIDDDAFETVSVDDITPGVLAAVSATERFKRTLMQQHAPLAWRPILRRFAGVEGSWLHRGLSEGTTRYLCASLRRRGG